MGKTNKSWEILLMVTRNPAITSWGKGSWSHYLWWVSKYMSGGCLGFLPTTISDRIHFQPISVVCSSVVSSCIFLFFFVVPWFFSSDLSLCWLDWNQLTNRYVPHSLNRVPEKKKVTWSTWDVWWPKTSRLCHGNVSNGCVDYHNL